MPRPYGSVGFWGSIVQGGKQAADGVGVGGSEGFKDGERLLILLPGLLGLSKVRVGVGQAPQGVAVDGESLVQGRSRAAPVSLQGMV